VSQVIKGVKRVVSSRRIFLFEFLHNIMSSRQGHSPKPKQPGRVYRTGEMMNKIIRNGLACGLTSPVADYMNSQRYEEAMKTVGNHTKGRELWCKPLVAVDAIFLGVASCMRTPPIGHDTIGSLLFVSPGEDIPMVQGQRPFNPPLPNIRDLDGIYEEIATMPLWQSFGVDQQQFFVKSFMKSMGLDHLEKLLPVLEGYIKGDTMSCGHFMACLAFRFFNSSFVVADPAGRGLQPWADGLRGFMQMVAVNLSVVQHSDLYNYDKVVIIGNGMAPSTCMDVASPDRGRSHSGGASEGMTPEDVLCTFNSLFARMSSAADERMENQERVITEHQERLDANAMRQNDEIAELRRALEQSQQRAHELEEAQRQQGAQQGDAHQRIYDELAGRLRHEFDEYRRSASNSHHDVYPQQRTTVSVESDGAFHEPHGDVSYDWAKLEEELREMITALTAGSQERRAELMNKCCANKVRSPTALLQALVKPSHCVKYFPDPRDQHDAASMLVLYNRSRTVALDPAVPGAWMVLQAQTSPELVIDHVCAVSGVTPKYGDSRTNLIYAVQVMIRAFNASREEGRDTGANYQNCCGHVRVEMARYLALCKGLDQVKASAFVAAFMESSVNKICTTKTILEAACEAAKEAKSPGQNQGHNRGRGGGGQQQTRFSGQCYNCGKLGHKSDQCFSGLGRGRGGPQPYRGQSQSGSQYGSQSNRSQSQYDTSSGNSQALGGSVARRF
jgi:hypothetical protein